MTYSTSTTHHAVNACWDKWQKVANANRKPDHFADAGGMVKHYKVIEDGAKNAQSID